MTFDTFVVIWTQLVGIFLIVAGLVMHTRNFLSALCFKVLPFIFGCGLCIISLKLAGVV